MKLDRNINSDGKGKYALVKLRMLEGSFKTKEELAKAIMENPECLNLGEVGTPDEFFPILLKDAFAQNALQMYAKDAHKHDKEYGVEIQEMVNRSGVNSPFMKIPD